MTETLKLKPKKSLIELKNLEGRLSVVSSSGIRKNVTAIAIGIPQIISLSVPVLLSPSTHGANEYVLGDKRHFLGKVIHVLQFNTIEY